MMCLYCGAESGENFPCISVCICGRSGNWSRPLRPKLIDCGTQFNTPDWLRSLRRWWYERHPANGPIVSKAISDACWPWFDNSTFWKRP